MAPRVQPPHLLALAPALALSRAQYVEALSQPFSTVIFEVFPLQGNKTTWFDKEISYADEERAFEAAATYLLETCAGWAGRHVSFWVGWRRGARRV